MCTIRTMLRLPIGPAAIAAMALALLVAGCDGGSPAAETATESTATSGTETERATSSVAVYLLRDGKVNPVRRSIASTPAVARAALTELLDGPTSDERANGLSSAIPDGTTLRDISLAGGVATVDFDGTFDDGDGSSASVRGRVAQIVATLTRFPTIERVAFRIDGKPVDAIGEDAVVVDPPVGRRAIEEQTPQILIESPLPGDSVRSPIRLRGTANVFEATVSIDVRGANGKLLKRTFTTATSGTGTRGTFDTELALPDQTGAVTIVAYEASAEDGSALHVVELPLELGR